MTVEILAWIIAGIAAAVALAAAGSLVWPLARMRLPQRVSQRLGRVAAWWSEGRDRRNK